MTTIQAVQRFTVHVLAGVLCFILVAASAVVLRYVGVWAKSLGVPGYILSALDVAEVCIAGLDVFCMGIFLFRETYLFVKHALLPEAT